MNFEEETPPKHNGTHSTESSIPSNSSSSPSNNVIHFDAQVSLFKPSKRFFCHQDLTSSSMEESEEEELEQVESEEEQSEEEDSEDEESEEEESEEEVSESEESENVCLTSDLDDSVSIMLSIPENVMHFNTQTSLFKCSKRFFNNQDLASQSLEISEGEEESEKEENEEEMDEEDDPEVKDVEEENNESEKEDEDVEEKDEENEEEELEEEDDESEESVNDCLTSDSSDRFLYTSSISSDHIFHFNQNTTLFKYSRRFFKQDLTSPSMEESEEEELEQVESEEEQSEEEESEDEDSEAEESEEEVSEEEVSESEESVNGVLTSDLDDSISIMSSIPENVMHFNTQLCLFKCSKRFFNNQDLASQSIEMSEGEEESEKEDDGEELDEEDDTEVKDIEEENNESEKGEEEMEEDEDVEEKDEEDESEEEDDESEESVNDCLTSDLDDKSFYSSSISSDHVLHFDHHTTPFKYSKRFFNHDLTSRSIEESEDESRKEHNDHDEEEEEEEKDKEDGEGEQSEGKVSEDYSITSDDLYCSPSVVVEASNYNGDGEENPHAVKYSLIQRTSHNSRNVPVSSSIIYSYLIMFIVC